jgi:hypothetical protein
MERSAIRGGPFRKRQRQPRITRPKTVAPSGLQAVARSLSRVRSPRCLETENIAPHRSTDMRKVYVVFIVAGVSILLFGSGIFALEYNRVQNLCRSSQSRVETTHDAMNAIRSYRVESGIVGRILSRVRQTDAFQSDGYATFIQNDDGYRYRKGGGWRVEEWTKPWITRGYSVDFEYFDLEFQPVVEIKCDVLECGAIDIRNCLTLGGVY